MFGIGVPELILILVVGLIVFGPSKLPEVGRAVGKGLREFRKAQAALTTAMNEPDPPKQAPAQPAPQPATTAAPPQPQAAATASVPQPTAQATTAQSQAAIVSASAAIPTADAVAPAHSVAGESQPQRPEPFPPAKEEAPEVPKPQELHLEAKPTAVAADYHAPTQEEVRAQVEAQKKA